MINSAEEQDRNDCVLVQRLTTAFFGLACSWDISSSCSGVHTRTLLSTLNQPLHRKTRVRGTSDCIQIQTVLHVLHTWHPLATQQTPDRFSHPSQCSARSPSRDYPQSPCKEANRSERDGSRVENRKSEEAFLTLQLGCRWFPSASPRCRCRSTSACCPSVQTSASSSF